MRCFALGFILLLPLCTRGFALDLYIAPGGNDHWSGLLAHPNSERTDGPLASLQGARDVARKRAHAQESVTITVADGAYPMPGPLELGPQDGGTAGFPVIYRAAEGARPVFSGGQVVTGWKDEGNGLWTARIPETAGGHWVFEQLWVNGRRVTRAREPNQGFFYVAGADEQPLPDTGSGVPATWTHQTIEMKAEDVLRLKGMGQAERDAVQIVAYHYWETTRRFLAGFDPATAKLEFNAGPKHSYAGIKAGTRYHLENALGFLDAPGEWFLDRQGTLYYRPRPGEKMDQAEVVAPRLESFLILKGDPASGRLVEHMAFKGLAFRYSQWITPPDGVRPFQASVVVDATMMADGARDIAFEKCEISHTGKYGLWLRRGCQAIRVEECLLRDLGGGGIRIGEETAPAIAAEQTGGVEIDNSIITGGGRVFAAAVGIWIGQSSDNQITHNDVSDFYYTGISVGWQWGYAASTAANNRIDFNHVHHLGWGLMSDLGGVYTLGVSPGTHCEGNLVHDIAAADYGGYGIYLDEGSSSIRVADNLVYAATHGGFHQHYGKDNWVENNIFALNQGIQLRLTRQEDHRSLVFRHNLVYWRQGGLFSRAWEDGNIESDENLYFYAGRVEPEFHWPPAREVHSLVADPRFVRAESGDFALAADSPAVRVGFKPFDYHKAGVYGPPAWRELAASLANPPRPDWATRNPFDALRPAQ